MSVFDGLRNHDLDPPLNTELIELGLYDLQIPRRDPWPERAMDWIVRRFWLLYSSLFVLAIGLGMAWL